MTTQQWLRLLKINPWKYEGDRKADIFLGFDPFHKKHCVMVLRDYWDGGWPDPEPSHTRGSSFVIFGESPEDAVNNAIAAAEERRYV